MRKIFLFVILLSFFTALFGEEHDKQFFVPDHFSEYDLIFDKPVKRWDEALPLGNGMMGILVWGDGQPLKLSLDRADLWDARPVKEWQSPDYNYKTMRRWVKEGRIDLLHKLYEESYDKNAAPTKIPAGRIQIDFPDGVKVDSSRLGLKNAVASVYLSNGSIVSIFQHAQKPIGILKIEKPGKLTQIKLNAPQFGGAVKSGEFNSLNTGSLARLGYPAPKEIKSNSGRSFEQQGWGDFRFAVSLKWKNNPDGSLECAWSIATTNESDNPLTLAEERAQAALAEGFSILKTTHTKWWTGFWKQAGIFVPNPLIAKQWYLDTYKFGSTARRGAPPISLQAVWTADEGKLPPWKGDYHHDLNTELSYWPCYSGNHLEEGLGYLDWLWETRPQAREYTRKFYNKPGINVPMTADINGRQIGGWQQYAFSSTISCWLSHHFYLHWRYSMDREFLKNRTYPYLKESAEFIEAITEIDEQGKRYLPLSSSPEIFDNKLKAWMPPTTNYDLALMRWLFSKTAECADELGLAEEKKHWLSVLNEFPDFTYAKEDGRLLVAKDIPLPFSHRHFSHLMAIHPLNLINWENGVKDQQIIKNALIELDRFGTDYWTGYSFAWLASLAARAKDGEKAEQALEIFSKAFCSLNSFHLNGDQTKSGYSKFTYRPFTLEGNMAAAAGLQEMLLQSYDGVIRIFPAAPASWKNIGFYKLRAEGAFLISAKKENGMVKRVVIFSEKGGKLKLQNPFGIDNFKVTLNDCKQISGDNPILKFECKPGATIVLYNK